MLHSSNLDYEYEPETFKLPNGETYTPDFIIDEEIVVEIKGWPDEKSKRRARNFMNKFSEYEYLVIGNEIPCDQFIAWENSDNLIEVIS